DAGKRRRPRARQHSEWRAAAGPLYCVEEAHGARDCDHGDVHQPWPQGCAHIIAASFYRGGEVIAPDLTPEQRKAYYDAENEAVDLINADFYKYAHHVTASAKGALEPHELLRAFVRYKHVDYYDSTRFTQAYDWMKERGLTEGQ